MGQTDRLLCAPVVIHSLSDGGAGMETKMLLSPLNKLDSGSQCGGHGSRPLVCGGMGAQMTLS